MSGGGIAERLADVRERIAETALGCGRDPSSVRLVAVTTGVAAERVREAIDAGAVDLGENKAQELTEKMTALAEATPLPRWHFVGSLQRNKVKLVAGRVALIHSVDSEELGRAIGARAMSDGVVQDVLIEVNVWGEASKHGVAPERAWDLVASLAGVEGIALRGLMTIAPAGAGVAARAAFGGLRELRDQLRSELGGGSLAELSMGMTSDFEIAIEAGATIVRIGTAIFGARR
ncbi:MAG: YggS family pyridoxal phosphate-dependent enzyme [Actinomycetota bacterium]